MNKKLSKKEMITDIAGEYFSKYGYEATSLEAIAKECDISKPAIYYHFKDKASLYEAVLLKRFSELSRSIEQNTILENPEENLTVYIQTFGNYLIKTPCFSAIFAREIANDAKSMPDSCVIELSKTLKRLASILESGKKKGIFECENPFMIQMMVVNTLTSSITTKTLRERVFNVLGESDKDIDPNIENVIENLSKKIIKALTC
jgi:AcrR family transcriptional regulator